MWQVEGEWASLRAREFVARVSPLHPHEGLRDVLLGENRIVAARLLQLRSLDLTGQKNSPDFFVRGCDLAVQYTPSTDSSVSCQVYWRAVEWADPRAVGVELVVSVQTNLADIDAKISFGSEIPCIEILQLGQDGTRRLALADASQQVGAADAGQIRRPGPLLYRLPEGTGSCVEMVHPVDFVDGQLQMVDVNGTLARSAYALFDERLEKGVILRARAQALFVPTEDDESASLECYHRFAASPPPLTA